MTSLSHFTIKDTPKLADYVKSHKLFTKDSPKTIKGEKFGYATLVLYLRPYTSSGLGNLCPMAKAAKCFEPCLNTAGHGIFDNVQQARQWRTVWFYQDRAAFVQQICKEIALHEKWCKKNNFIPVIRLNGTSDFPWETLGIFEQFPSVIFYDYTKIPSRIEKYLAGKMPSNYKLCYSLSVAPGSRNYARTVLRRGGNVAVVYGPSKIGHMPKSFELPQFHLGSPVVDGDKSDLTFLNPPGTILGLRAKGKAKHDVSGFVVREIDEN